MKRTIRLTESELIEMVRRVITEESGEIKKISDLERFYNKKDTSLNDHILNVVNKTIDDIDTNGFKNEDHFLEQMGGLITITLLRGTGFYFKQKDQKYRSRVKEFLFEYIPKKYKSKLKSKWNERKL
jgi:hypothetical protein